MLCAHSSKDARAARSRRSLLLYAPWVHTAAEKRAQHREPYPLDLSANRYMLPTPPHRGASGSSTVPRHDRHAPGARPRGDRVRHHRRARPQCAVRGQPRGHARAPGRPRHGVRQRRRTTRPDRGGAAGRPRQLGRRPRMRPVSHLGATSATPHATFGRHVAAPIWVFGAIDCLAASTNQFDDYSPRHRRSAIRSDVRHARITKTWAVLSGSVRHWFAGRPHRLRTVGAAGGAVTVGLGVRLLLTRRD